MERETKAEQLYEEAQSALDESDWNRAAAIGRQLKKLRHSSAFEILARVLKAREKLNRAIDVLEEGVERAPDVYLLWHQLGCYYSDANRFEDAHRAFSRSRVARKGPYPLSVLNEAIVFIREENAVAALELLDTIEPDDEDVDLLSLELVRIRAMMDLDRFEAVIQKCTELILSPNDNEKEPLNETGLGPDAVSASDNMAELYSQRARARWLLDSDREGALSDAFDSLRIAFNESAADLIRKIRDQQSKHARFYRYMLEGRLPGDIGIPDFGAAGYYVTCEAVADSIEQAIEYAREVLIVEERESIRLEEVLLEEDAVDKAKGLTFMAGRSIFPLEDAAD